MAARELQGWHPDPFGLHEMRYFSVGRPTKLVRDGRAEAYDEPPEDWSAAGAQAIAVDGQRAVAAETGLPAVRPVGAAMPPTTAAATSATPLPTTATPTQVDPAAPTRFYPAVQIDQTVAPVVQGPAGRPPRRRMEYAFVAAGAVVAVLVFVALGGGAGKGKAPISPAAFVTRAAQRTLAQNTADLTVTGTVTVNGQSEDLGGSGQVDMTTNAMSLTVDGSLSNVSMTESEVLVNGNLYLNVSSNGQGVAAVTGGRHWIEIPIAQSGARSLTNESPASSLFLLSQQGAKVTSLGPTSVNGLSCNGYSVTPSRADMLAATRQDYAKLGLSAADTSTAMRLIQTMKPPTITAWFDQSRQLACRVSINMQIGAPSSASSTATSQMVVNFTHFGTPVKITAPAPSDTISLQQLLKLRHP